MATEAVDCYCSVADLRQNIAGLTDDNTKVPESYLVDLLARKSAIINSYICTQYVTPVTEAQSPIAFAMLKDICIALTKPPVADRLKVSTPKRLDKEGNQYPVHEGLADAMRMLKLIKDGLHKLPDAIRCSECDAFDSGDYDRCDVEGIPDEVPYDDRVELPERY